MGKITKLEARTRRKKGIRKNLFGNAERPRMSVFRSNKHIYVQVIDDVAGKTLAAASTLDKELRASSADMKKRDAAKKVGELVAQRCAEAKVTTVIYDRNGFLYTGRVAALADGARAGGLKF